MKQSWKISVAFIVVFLAGGAIGSVFTLRLTRPRPQAPAPTQPENFGTALAQRWLRENQLNLTPDQKKKARPIVSDTAEDLRRLRRENSHSEELIIEHMQDEIAALLNPTQRIAFTDLIAKQRQLIQQYFQDQQRKAAQQKLEQDKAKP
jgi:hypothetical protein